MKDLRLFFAALLAPLVFQAMAADDTSADISRAATRRNSTSTVSSSRAKKTTPIKKPATSAASRATTVGISGPSVRSRPTTTDSETRVTQRQPASSPETTTRTLKQIQPRSIRISATKNSATYKTPNTTSTHSNRTPDISRSAIATRTRSAGPAPTTSTTDRTSMLNRDFSKCRDVFYSCMDEFCANKDTQLKRCACSSRINEFDRTKKSLATAEDKLLDFSQRLLTVNLDKEDALAINQETAGEKAFAAEDRSQSKKILDEIAKKLNTSFNDSNFDQELNAISLSLNIDAAFDNVDSLAGASTTTKTGTALYSAALPVCREMALEVCTPDDLSIAEGGYQVKIEQDCNTVKKSYQTQADMAREQVFESSALLDISRLNVHQKRNSDDILTCKRKMLDMLSDPTVCGKNLGKCLDTSGRYIDPTTGDAILTTELAYLSTLIHRPVDNQTWSTAPGNGHFVSYLQTKKKYLEPAMEKCQDISDYVWQEFIEDALPQIKLAQESKLEEIRQSCTTLLAQCLDTTADTIADFDARALSIFGIQADKTVNAMCSDIKTSCNAVLNTSGGGTDWSTGVDNIQTDQTYETILQTCREVGRACIIQACTSTSGNFGLCENIDSSIYRKSIINREACWPDVLKCVASAGPDAIAKLKIRHPLNSTVKADGEEPHYDFYNDLYYNGQQNLTITYLQSPETVTSACIANDSQLDCVHDICHNKCSDEGSTECYECRLAERIWGNCEVPPSTKLDLADGTIGHNKIKIPVSGETDTLLAWFAKNTGTANAADNCRDTTCPTGQSMTIQGFCATSNLIDDHNNYCPAEGQIIRTTDNSPALCCTTNKKDKDGENCCLSGNTTNTINASMNLSNVTYVATTEQNALLPATELCAPEGITAYNHVMTNGNDIILCSGDVEWGNTAGIDSIGFNNQNTDGYPNGTEIKCKGTLYKIRINGTTKIYSNGYYIEIIGGQEQKCTFNFATGAWTTSNDTVCQGTLTQGTFIK